MAQQKDVQQVYPRTRLQFLREYPIGHTLRVMITLGGRVFESPRPNVVVHPKGVTVFTIHPYQHPSGKPDNLFADEHGWAIPEGEVRRMINQRIVKAISC